jgi:hypothetical protein
MKAEKYIVMIARDGRKSRVPLTPSMEKALSVQSKERGQTEAEFVCEAMTRAFGLPSWHASPRPLPPCKVIPFLIAASAGSAR